MSNENKSALGIEASVMIEDLTLSETETAHIKGGPSDYLLDLDGVKGESRIIRSTNLITTYDLKAAKK